MSLLTGSYERASEPYRTANDIPDWIMPIKVLQYMITLGVYLLVFNEQKRPIYCDKRIKYTLFATICRMR